MYKHSQTAVLVLCMLVAKTHGLHSVEPPKIHPSRNWHTFTTTDGLPNDHIRAIHVDGPRVWVGTDNGLALRDGETWKSWTTDDGLPSRVVTAIDTDPNTVDLWIGTSGGGLTRFTGGRFDRFNQLNSGIAGNLVFDVAIIGGRVWVATNGGVSVYDVINKTWRLPIARRADRPEIVVIDFSLMGGTLFAADWCGHLRSMQPRSDFREFPPDLPAPILHVDRISPRHVVAMTSNAHTLWCATTNHLMCRKVDGAWRRFLITNASVPDRFIRCLATTSDGMVLAGTDHGLHELVDPTADAWVTHTASDKGSFTCTAGPRTLHDAIFDNPTAPSAAEDQVRAIATVGQDLWIGTNAGLFLGTVSTPNPTTSFRSHVPVPSFPHSLDPSPPICIAVIGPITRTIPLPGSVDPLIARSPSTSRRPDLLAVQLAVEQANVRGGFRGRTPFSIYSASETYVITNYGWGAVEDELVALANERQVYGIIAHIASDHRITTRAVLEAEVPVMNVARSSPSMDESINPWMFRPHPSPDSIDPEFDEFVTTYTNRHRARRAQQPPDQRAIQSYRAARILLDSISAAGADRTAIRDVLRKHHSRTVAHSSR